MQAHHLRMGAMRAQTSQARMQQAMKIQTPCSLTTWTAYGSTSLIA